LIMTFGTSTIPRFWRIKIAMLPCDSDYLGIRVTDISYISCLSSRLTIISRYSPGRVPAVFHVYGRLYRHIQLEGHHLEDHTSTGQSGLLHVFQDRIGAQTSGNNLVIIWMDSFPDVIIPIGKSNRPAPR
jgi:hypothetical protein